MDDLFGAILGLCAAVAVAAAYVYGSYLLIIHVMGPVVFLALGIGLVSGIVLCTMAATRGLVTASAGVVPSDYRTTRQEQRRRTRGQLQLDSAFPIFPMAQWRADLVCAWCALSELNSAVWNWELCSRIGLRGSEHRKVWFVWPVPATAALAMGAALIAEWAGYAVVALVSALVVVVAYPFVVAVALILRAADGGWRHLVRGEASCPACYHVSPFPAYACPGCGALHRDLRPGRLGAVYRRCECDALMPTTIVRAAWRLEARCQQCSHPLREGAAAVRDIRIPVFGAVSSGKTRFVYAVLDSFLTRAAAGGRSVGYADNDSETRGEIGLKLIRDGLNTTKTRLGLLPALSLRLGSRGRAAALVHLFDGAGELYMGDDHHDDAGYLSTGQALVYVLDPFSIGRLHDQLATGARATLALAQPATAHPETMYGEVVNRIRDRGIKSEKQNLAVVVSKTDLLSAAGVVVPTDSDALAEFLVEMGLYQLVTAARREFASVRFFAVASVPADESGEFDAGLPVEWLIGLAGGPVPTRAVPAPAAAVTAS